MTTKMSLSRISGFLVVSGALGAIGAFGFLAPDAGASSGDVYVGPNRTYTTIQAGINASTSGCTVYVDADSDLSDSDPLTPYRENIDLGGRNITLAGFSGAGGARPIIEGNTSGQPVVKCSSSCTSLVWHFEIRQQTDGTVGRCIEGSGADLDVLNCWIRWGTAPDPGGGAAAIGGGLLNVDGQIRQTTIEYCTADVGGGLAQCDGIIGGLVNPTTDGNTIRNNDADWHGGGLANCHGTIIGNDIHDNSAEGNTPGTGGTPELFRGGGGLSGCHGTIEGNSIHGNTATELGSYGGGLLYCGGDSPTNTGKIVRNRIFENSANNGGGAALQFYGEFSNNLVYENDAIRTSSLGGEGGGITRFEANVVHCTIIRNTAYKGGGVHTVDAPGKLRGTTVSHNTATGNNKHNVQALEKNPNYCCVPGWTGGGTVVVTNTPAFVQDTAGYTTTDPATWDLTPASNSSAVDKSIWLSSHASDITTDFLGATRNPPYDVPGQGKNGSSNRLYDIGAYERRIN